MAINFFMPQNKAPNAGMLYDIGKSNCRIGKS